MAKYPAWVVGSSVSATNLAAGLPDVYVKESSESITSDATLNTDATLNSIPLSVGRHWIRLLLMWTTSTSATPDIKTQWAFSGTWTTPVRACCGPGPTNTATADAITPSKMRGISANADAIYGSGASALINVATEEAFLVDVTVAGDLALQWAQNTSDAGALLVRGETSFVIKQIE